MQFALICRDAPGALENRKANRPEHLAGLIEAHKAGHIVKAGAMLDDQGEMCGSVVLVDYPDRAALDEFLAKEPFVRENVWEKIEVIEMRLIDFDTL